MKIGLPPLPVPPGSDAANEGRAARFCERGMFGLSLAVEAARATFGPPRGSPAHPAARSDRDRQFSPLPEGRNEAAPVQMDALAAGGQASAAAAPPCIDSVSPEPAPACALGAPAPGLAAPEADERPAAAPVRLRLTESRRRDVVSLTLREQSGAVEIVAAGGPVDAESRLHLRRLIEAMLSRSGLVLAHFQLNGAPVAPDFLSRAGGTHGTRTR
jgi:hypothetical protein